MFLSSLIVVSRLLGDDKTIPGYVCAHCLAFPMCCLHPGPGEAFHQGFPAPGQSWSIPQEQHFLRVSSLDSDSTPCGSSSATAQPLVTAP